ncbi:MAG: MltA domain-containing protein [Pseudomonadota bacterium]
MDPSDDATAALAGRRSCSSLPGWAADDLAAALEAFRRMPHGPLADEAARSVDPSAFFDAVFRPADPISGHVTGYYEPEIPGALARSDAFPVPLHSEPSGGCTRPRAEIDTHLEGEEIVWLRDEVDRFFAQVQGSARIRLTDGSVLRVGYAATNGHPYVSIGKRLIESGVFGPDITAGRLAAWLRADSERGRAVMRENPSYVFFRRLETDPAFGPTTTLGCSATAGRTLAVDVGHIPLGTPVWVEVDGSARLCIAQDTGSAIRGAGRADLFFGTGESAGRAAGRLNHPGRLTPFLRR